MEQQKETSLKWFNTLTAHQRLQFLQGYYPYSDILELETDDQIQFIYENEMAKEWWENKTSGERLLLVVKYGFSDGGQSQILSIYLAENKSIDCLDREAYGKYCPSCLPVNPDSPGEVKQAGEGNPTYNSIRLEVEHIFESGANELRIIELIERLLQRKHSVLSTALAKANAEKEEMRQLLIQSVSEINHLKHEYKDVGHGIKYLTKVNELLFKIE